jgi:hypothetical protein
VGELTGLHNLRRLVLGGTFVSKAEVPGPRIDIKKIYIII